MLKTLKDMALQALPARAWALVAVSTAVVVVGLSAAGAFRSTAPQLDALKAAEQRADSALASAAVSRQHVDSLKHVADAALAGRDSAAVRADSIGRVASRLRGVFAAQAAVAPDTCKAVVAAADSALEAADFYADTLRGLIMRSQLARFALEKALDTATATIDRLQSATTPLVRAADVVVRSAKRDGILSRIARVLPHPGFGATAGLDATGKPNIVYGASLGWSF